jgi:hypothetical protein
LGTLYAYVGDSEVSTMTSQSRMPRPARIYFVLPFATSVTMMAHAEDAPPREAAVTEDDGAAEGDSLDDEDEYGRQGTVELGGSIGIDWTNDAFSAEVSPTVGYFVLDLVELSALLRFSYVSQEDDDGDRTSIKGGAFVVEPSYHLPLQKELFLETALGVGVGHDGDNADFELIPRVGLNIGVGLVGLLTPAVSVPILFDGDGTTAGLGFEVGYSVTW